MKSIDKATQPNGTPATALTRAKCKTPNPMKNMGRVLLTAAALFFAGVSSATTLPVGQLSYEQLSAAIRYAEHDTYSLSGFIGAPVSLDLRPVRGQSYFASTANVQGIAFACSINFTDFTGGPVKATIARFEFGEDSRDFIALDGCTAQER